jgi:hypothetical protein
MTHEEIIFKLLLFGEFFDERAIFFMKFFDASAICRIFFFKTRQIEAQNRLVNCYRKSYISTRCIGFDAQLEQNFLDGI